MNSHDRSARGKRWQYVMWRVKEVRPDANKVEGDSELFGDRIVARPVWDRFEVRTELFNTFAVLAPADQHVLRIVIETCEPPDEVLYVRTDAKIVQLSDVYRHPHQ